jgi:hypothetical protein
MPMSTEISSGQGAPSSQSVIDRLVDDLAPVEIRRVRRDALLIGGVALIELALVLGLGRMRPDLHEAMRGAIFWWKAGSVLVVAVAGLVALLAAFDPAATMRRTRGPIAGAAALALLAGAVLGGIAAIPDPLMARLDMREGMACVRGALLLAVPMLVAIVFAARRAAPTRPRATATLAGITAAGWGAFVFSWSCPHADPLYVIAWYGGAVALGALLARWLLPQALRW